MSDDDDLEETSRGSPDATAIEEYASAIRAADPDWRPGVTLDLGGVKWTPNLLREDRKWTLHVHQSAGVPKFAMRRLVAARDAGYGVHLALSMESFYDRELLLALAEVDGYTYVRGGDYGRAGRRHYLAAMADLGVPVPSDLRRSLASRAWSRMGEGTGNERGRRLEALLSFLLGQVADLRVFSRNYRTETQEIDIVLQVDNISTRCWSTPGVPFVLVEAKNTSDAAGQPVVSLLIRKLETKRGSARLGLLFAVAGFTSDARAEELRLSQTEYCVAMFDSDDISTLINADDLDAALEAHIGRALLR